MKYIYRSLTDVGRVRSANEDNLGESQTPNGHLFVVCDGMGGHVGGATASAKAVESLIEFFNKDTYDNPIQALDHALSFANEQIYATAMIQPELKGMGTTAVVVLVQNEECYIAHVGDSRIYLFSDGKLNRLTKDHSYVQTLVDANIIADEDAENHPNKNQILQALGIAPVVKSTVCVAPVLPKKGDVFLLCSDGMNGMVNDREMERLLHAHSNEDWPQVFINAALEAGGKDNVTASFIEITESSHLDSSFVNFNPVSVDHLNRTREVHVEDLSANSGSKKGRNKSTKRMYLYAGLGFLLSAIAFAILFFIKKPAEPQQSNPQPTKSIPKKDTLLDTNALKTVFDSCDSTRILALNNRKCNFNNDTVSHSCQNFKCDAIVGRDSTIKIKMVMNPSVPSNAVPAPKQLASDYFVIAKKDKFNTLSAILMDFKVHCSDMTYEKIINYNIQENEIFDVEENRKKLLKKDVSENWKILCPPCNSTKQ